MTEIKNSPIIRVTKEFSFEMAHALEGYDGLCKNIHGHSYKLFVTVIGQASPATCNSAKEGMVIDFKDLKQIVGSHIVDKYDHALVLKRIPKNEALKENLSNHHIELTDYQPTCENMIADFASILRKNLPSAVQLHHIKLHETATSFAEWYATDNITE